MLILVLAVDLAGQVGLMYAFAESTTKSPARRGAVQ